MGLVKRGKVFRKRREGREGGKRVKGERWREFLCVCRDTRMERIRLDRETDVNFKSPTEGKWILFITVHIIHERGV